MVVPSTTLPRPDKSAVVIAGREFKAALLARESRQNIQMTKAWITIEKSIEADIIALANKIDELVQTDLPVTRGQLQGLTEYRELLAKAKAETAKYAKDFVDPFVETGQREIIGLATGAAGESIELSFFGISPNFNRLNPEALEFMVGTAGNGEPLDKLIKARVKFGPTDAQRVLDTLFTATARGFNPAKTANLIKNDLVGGLNKALLISRSEQLRAYREASRAYYESSGLVKGYKRISARDPRVCAACLMADGTFYPTDQEFPEHPQGRCTLIPVVIGAEEPNWQTGKFWFGTQPDEVQSQILGPQKFAAYKAGEFKLDDLITERRSPTWGPSLVPTPLKDLVKEK